jgi:hypothetical protein
LEPGLSENIKHALKVARGIEQLYIHQVAAIDALSQRQHVIVSTSTASGKSVIYQVAIMIGIPLLALSEQALGAFTTVLGERPKFYSYFYLPDQGIVHADSSVMVTDGARLSLKISAAHSSSCWLHVQAWNMSRFASVFLPINPMLRSGQVATYDGDTPQEQRVGHRLLPTVCHVTMILCRKRYGKLRL